MAKILLAKSAGFCFGVDRAVKLVNDLIDDKKEVAMLGPIIHNPGVIEGFKKRGVETVNSVSELKENKILVLRTHGVEKEIMSALKDGSVQYADSTCPFVKKIQKIADENGVDATLIICGDPTHPEVKGIKSYAQEHVFVVSNVRELENLIEKHDNLRDTPVVLVAQTTFSIKEWENSVKKAKLLCTNLKIFDTICSATEERQKEAYELSLKCDAMIIVGGRQSSNTAKLADVCRENATTFLVEDACELTKYDFRGFDLIGISAGASTPADIIKEVLETMSELLNETNSIIEEEKTQESAHIFGEEAYDYEAALEESLNNYGSDKLVVGTVISVTPTEIQVDIGRKQTGYIPYDEYSSDPNIDPKSELNPGDKLNLIIMKTNDLEGTVVLSKRICDAAKVWDDIVAAQESGETLEGTICDAIRGGVLVRTKGIRVFVPASLVGASRDTDLETLIHNPVKLKIIEVNKQRKRAVGSIRAALRDSRKEAEEAFWAQAREGQVINGTVKSLTNYGAFVDIGGVDGMIHISELSWKRIKHPSEVLKVGDTAEVYIKNLDYEKKKISLGYKKIEDNPWEILRRDYPVDSVVNVKVVGLTTFGAFAQIITGIDGLIHISQIANRRISKTSDALSVGDLVTAKITDINFDKRRVSLSIRALLPPNVESENEAEPSIYEEVAADIQTSADSSTPAADAALKEDEIHFIETPSQMSEEKAETEQATPTDTPEASQSEDKAVTEQATPTDTLEASQSEEKAISEIDEKAISEQATLLDIAEASEYKENEISNDSMNDE